MFQMQIESSPQRIVHDRELMLGAVTDGLCTSQGNARERVEIKVG